MQYSAENEARWHPIGPGDLTQNGIKMLVQKGNHLRQVEKYDICKK